MSTRACRGPLISVTDVRKNENIHRRPKTPGIAYVDGNFVALENACVPLLDWGFNKSDVVYDGIPFADGRIFRLEDHLQRFAESMKKWHLPEPNLASGVADICHDLVARSGLRDGIMYICTTRGLPPSAEVRDPTRFQSRFYGWSQEVPQLGTQEQLDRGLTMIVSGVPRIPTSSVDSTAKNFHWGDLIQARIEAADRGAQNALLLSHDGNLAEGVGFNVFVIVDGNLRTPGKDCLHGITRRTVLEIAQSEDVDATVTDIPASDLQNASEIFITSSAGGVFAVTTLDGRQIGDGVIGPLTSRIRAEYWRRRVSTDWSVQVDYDNYRCAG